MLHDFLLYEFFDIVKPKDYLNLLLIDQQFYYNGYPHHNKIKKNPLIYLLEKYPDKPWNWHGVSQNPNITPEYIETHPELPWRWHSISYNPNITPEFIESHPELPWNWNCIISRNP